MGSPLQEFKPTFTDHHATRTNSEHFGKYGSSVVPTNKPQQAAWRPPPELGFLSALAAMARYSPRSARTAMTFARMERRIRALRAEQREDIIARRTAALRVFLGSSDEERATVLRRLLRAERRAAHVGVGYDAVRHAALCRLLAEAETARPPTVRRATKKAATRGGGLPDRSSPNASGAVPSALSRLLRCADAAGRDPSPSRAPNAPPHSWVQPSDSRPAGPTSRDTPRG